MSMTFNSRSLPEISFASSRSQGASAASRSGVWRRSAALWALLLTIGLGLGGAGCKSEKPSSSRDMSMTSGDLAMMIACESVKCENPDAKCCNGEPCVDVTANTQNCGECGKVCRTREQCLGGSCSCTGGGHSGPCASTSTCCADGCHETMTDLMNCGGCGLPCKMGETCTSGKCSCGPAGPACRGSQTCCGTGCADLQTDPKNCGKCGKTCPAGKACTSGVCEGECITCGTGETCCDGICANLLNDANNCKTCGHKCGVILGVPLPCIFGICAFAPVDGGTDAGAADMSMPTD